MRIGVIADFVAFPPAASHDPRIARRQFADNEEGSVDPFLLENVEDLGRVPRIGSVVKGQRHHLVVQGRIELLDQERVGVGAVVSRR